MKAECSPFSVSRVGTGDKSEGFRVMFFQLCILFLMDYGNFSKTVVVESQNICLHKVCLGFVFLSE